MIRGLFDRLREGALDRAGAALDRALVHAALDLARRAPEREALARDDHAGRLEIGRAHV